jgi:hypothetical protein
MYPPGNLYKAIKPVMRGHDADIVVAKIKSIVDDVGGWLTVSQANKILGMAEKLGIREKRGMPNLIVQLCHLPWDVDLKLGTYGLCYYGNFGDAPSLQRAIDMLRGRAQQRTTVYP